MDNFLSNKITKISSLNNSLLHDNSTRHCVAIKSHIRIHELIIKEWIFVVFKNTCKCACTSDSSFLSFLLNESHVIICIHNILCIWNLFYMYIRPHHLLNSSHLQCICAISVVPFAILCAINFYVYVFSSTCTYYIYLLYNIWKDKSCILERIDEIRLSIIWAFMSFFSMNVLYELYICVYSFNIKTCG